MAPAAYHCRAVPVLAYADDASGQPAEIDRSTTGNDELGHELHAAHRRLLRLELRLRSSPLLGDTEHLQCGPAVVHHRLGQLHQVGAVPTRATGAPAPRLPTTTASRSRGGRQRR